MTASREYDVVAVGSGVGGMASALAAACMGLDAIVLEKASSIGGTTAWGGGVAWMPVNDQMASVGQSDTREAALSYLSALTGNRGDRAVMESFVDHSGAALAFYRERTHVKFAVRAVSPDYRPGLDGAATGGRALDPLPFDERDLGPARTRLRGPLPFFTFAGSMLTPTGLRALMRAGRSASAAAGVAGMLARAGISRFTGVPAGPRTLGNALAARLLLSLIDHGVEVQTGAAVVELLRTGDRVSGVRLQDGSQITARRGVILAAGGFPHDPARRLTLLGDTEGDWSMAPPENTGDGLRMAESVGARIGDLSGASAHFTPVSVLRHADGTTERFPHLLLDRAKPGVIAVDRRGRRFVNESDSYHDFVLGMLGATPRAVPAWLICDDRALWRYGLGMVGPYSVGRRRLQKAGYLVSAPSLAGLAAACGIDPDGLAASVSRMNGFSRTGKDEDFGKGSTAYNRYLGDAEHQPNPCLGPIDRAPFHAIQVWPGDLGTAAGIVTDGLARALSAQGQPVPGLYAVGNDQHSVTAGSYPGSGGTIGPALTFAYLAARHLSEQDPRHAL